jgi:hypothetical protein
MRLPAAKPGRLETTPATRAVSPLIHNPEPQISALDRHPRAEHLGHGPRLGKASVRGEGWIAVKDFARGPQALNLQVIFEWRKESHGQFAITRDAEEGVNKRTE